MKLFDWTGLANRKVKVGDNFKGFDIIFFLDDFQKTGFDAWKDIWSFPLEAYLELMKSREGTTIQRGCLMTVERISRCRVGDIEKKI